MRGSQALGNWSWPLSWRRLGLDKERMWEGGAGSESKAKRPNQGDAESAPGFLGRGQKVSLRQKDA